MDSQFLETFLTVVDSGSIAEAARRLNLTAAGVTQRIRALEREIGARLTLRSGRNVRASEAGVLIVQHAEDLLRRVRDLKSIATADELAGELRLGAMQTALAGVLPRVLSIMMNKYPRIKVDVLRGGSHDLYRDVLHNELDAAIIAEPPFAIPKSCGWHVLRDEPLVVLASTSLSIRDPHKLLTSEPFIRFERNSWGGRLIDGYLRYVGIRPIERFEIDAPEAIAGMVDRGLGVSLMPDWAPPWPGGLSLLKIPVPANPFSRRVGLLWTKESVRARLVRAVLDSSTSALAGTQNTPVRKRHKFRRRKS